MRGTGKTTLIQRLQGKPFSKKYIATPELQANRMPAPTPDPNPLSATCLRVELP